MALELTSYPGYGVTADVVLIIDDSVLLIRRGRDPFKGKLALPGGFMDPDENIVTTAVRELREETGIVMPPDELVFDGVAQTPGRDPRGRILSFVFGAAWNSTEHDMSMLRSGDDAAAVTLIGLDDLKQKKNDMAFDHWDIIFGSALRL